MVDHELNLIYSIFTKCESDVRAIVSIIDILSKNKFEVKKFETEIKEIKEKLHKFEKIIENRNTSTNQADIISEKYILEKCHESLQSLKGSIINFKELQMNISDFTHTDKNLQINDCEPKPINDLLNDKFSELSIDNEINITQINNGNSMSSFNPEQFKNDDNDNFFCRNESHKPGVNEEKPVDSICEYKNLVGARVDIFQHLNTDIIDYSFSNKLEIQDSVGKHIQYTPRMVWHNPRSDFPSSPLENFTNPSFFEKLALDTLLFIFYFQQGTFQQFLSIQELKKKKWQFHKKCFAWFYKRSEPKITTEDAEVADYIYFDFEKDWCQKIKNDFTFEYIHLDTSPIVINKTSESNIYYNSKNCSHKDQTGLNSEVTDSIVNKDSALSDHCQIDHSNK